MLDVVSLAGLALPSFWVGTCWSPVGGARSAIFPASGYVTFAQSPSGWIEHLILPVAALSLLGVAAVAKQSRDAILSALEADYIAMLRGNGMSEREIMLSARAAQRGNADRDGPRRGGDRDARRNRVCGERLRPARDMGSQATQSTVDHDLPVILGIGLYFTVIVVIINLLVDLTYGLLNPRAKTT